MSKLNDVIKRLPLKIFKLYVGREIALGFIEGVLLRVNIYDVLHMIEQDKYNLFDGNQKAIEFVERSRRLLKEHEDIIRDVVTPETILAIIKEKRPDIYSLIINHKKGRKWVINTIKTTLEYIFDGGSKATD